MIAILFLYKYRENITTDSGKTLSDEAVQSIASVYNNQNMTIDRLNATSSITTPKITSPNGKYYLSVQDDGNLVLYDNSGNAKWDSVSAKNMQNNYEAGKIYSSDRKYMFVMQTDGNPAVWDPTNTNLKWAGIGNMKSMNGNYYLSMQNDGNLVVYDNHSNPAWTSNLSMRTDRWYHDDYRGGNNQTHQFSQA